MYLLKVCKCLGIPFSFLPAIELENDSSPELYAMTVQEKLATQMNFIYSEATSEDVSKWKEGKL